MEDLRVALTYEVPPADSIAAEEDLDWPEQMRLKQLREKGFNLVNELHKSLAKRYLEDMFSNKEPTESDQIDYVMLSIQKLVQDEEVYWPELVRLLMLHRVREAGEHYDYAFGP